jgi:hypothetical protein
LELSQAIHLVERELGVRIEDDYPLMKFFNQLDMIKWYRDEERKAHERGSLK